jgi:dye decolorizing peroxidase
MAPTFRPPVSRRALLAGGALSVGGALAGAATTVAATRGTPGDPAPLPSVGPGRRTEPFHGPHQAGVATPAQAHAAFVALDLSAGVDRDALRRLLRLLTDDAARLTHGQAPLADTEPDLAALPARLTVTVGFGPRLFDLAGLADQRPASLAQLAPFRIDRLDQRWCGGDLLL